MSSGHDQYQYAAVPKPDDSHPYTTPTSSNKSNALSSALLAAQEDASRKRVVGTTGLIAILIFFSLISLNVVFFSFICVVHQCQISKLSIVSTAPLGMVLTISQVTSHVAPVSVPVIMGLFSYLLAVKWLRSSLDGGLNRPSPMQLGLLMSMCNGANISSLFTAVKYFLKRPADNGEKVAPSPPILRESFLFLGSLLVVTYVAAAADAWLHATRQSVLISSNSTYYGSLPSFGRAINDTICASYGISSSDLDDQLLISTCGLINPGSGGSGSTLGEGVRVASNSSTLHRVTFTDDQTAILVPQTLPLNITYSAQTSGVKSQCTTVTKNCVGTSLGNGPDSGLVLDCVDAGIKYNASGAATPLCPLDNQGLCVSGWEISSNPITVGELITSFAYIGLVNQENDGFVNNTGWLIHGNKGAWNAVLCNVTALDVSYTYASSRYFLDSSTPKSLTTVRYMMSAGFPTSAVSTAVDGAGLQANSTYEQAYALELSRRLLAAPAFIFEPTNVTRIQSGNNVNGSRLQVIPLVLFITALLVFACQVLYISLRTVMVAWGVPYVGLAALHLSDPLVTVQRQYGHSDPVLTWEMDSTKQFGLESEEDRLSVGPVPLSVNGEQSSAFMILKIVGVDGLDGGRFQAMAAVLTVKATNRKLSSATSVAGSPPPP